MNPYLRQRMRWIGFALLSGAFSGLTSAIFLHLLQWATVTRENFPSIIWALPLAGLAIGWAYHQVGRDVAPGTNLIMDEMHDPRKVLPVKMAPFILFGTLVTHLFGGSAGREGTAVQMGASLSDQINRFFKIEREERRTLLVCGAGGAFGAAIGAPWAGVVFGAEVIHVGKLKTFAWLECAVASFTAYGVAVLLRAPHSAYPQIILPNFSWMTLLWVACAGLVFGLVARLFTLLTHLIEKLSAKFIKYPPCRPVVGGALLAVLFFLEGTNRFPGLGIPVIQESFEKAMTLDASLFKAGFTALTIGSGFKGGEFVPLVFIGATLASWLSLYLPVSLPLLASVGFAAVFAGAAQAPVACSIMAIELFGPDVAPFVFIGCVMSYLVAGESKIYRRKNAPLAPS